MGKNRENWGKSGKIGEILEKSEFFFNIPCLTAILHNHAKFYVSSMFFDHYRGGGGIHPSPGHVPEKKAQVR